LIVFELELNVRFSVGLAWLVRRTVVEVDGARGFFVRIEEKFQLNRVVDALQAEQGVAILVRQDRNDRPGPSKNSLFIGAVLIIVVPLSIIRSINLLSAMPLVPLLSGW